MDELIKILNNPQNHEEIVNALENFARENALLHVFVGKEEEQPSRGAPALASATSVNESDSTATKAKLLDCLGSIIVDSKIAKEREGALKCLKILLRELSAIGTIKPAVSRRIIEIATPYLRRDELDQSESADSNASTGENKIAADCVTNIAIQRGRIKAGGFFSAAFTPPEALELNDEKISSDILVGLRRVKAAKNPQILPSVGSLRLLKLVVAQNTNLTHELTTNQEYLELFTWLTEFINTNSPVHSPDAPIDSMMCVQELLKLIWFVTQPLGPVPSSSLSDTEEHVSAESGASQDYSHDPTPEQVDCFRRLIPIMQNALNTILPPNPILSGEHRKLRSAATFTMINLPACLTADFAPQATLAALINMLKQIMDEVPEGTSDISEISELVPVLLLLNSIAKGMYQSRSILKSIIFPNWENVQPDTDPRHKADAPREYRTAETLAGQLIPLMTSINTAVHHYTGELLYHVCDEDPAELTRLVGVGNAAGLLASRNMFRALGALASGERPSSVSVVRRDINENTPLPSSMSEADQVELNRLLERMEATGLLQVVTKDSTDDHSSNPDKKEPEGR